MAGEAEEKLKDLTDRNKKAVLKQQIKSVASIRNLAKEKGLYQDETFLKHLSYLLTYMMKDDFEVQLSLANSDGKSVFFNSPLARESLREPCDAIIRKYSRQCEEPLTLLGMITQGRKSKDLGTTSDEKGTPENFRQVLLTLVNATATIEETFFARLENEYLIDPIALFRQL